MTVRRNLLKSFGAALVGSAIPAQLQAWTHGASGSLPPPPTGFAYIVNADGAYIVNADGAYILAKV